MSPLTYHGPGERTDLHDLDVNAHAVALAALPTPAAAVATHNADAAAHAALLAAAVKGPDVIAPPATLIAASALATWPVINFVIAHRFTVPIAKAYRWAQFYAGALSGNFQVGVTSISRSGTTITGTRVMDSGVLAMSTLTANTPARVDLTATTLAPGEYALFLWCDNTTASFMNGLATGMHSCRLALNQTISGGVPGSVVTWSPSTRWVAAFTLESDS